MKKYDLIIKSNAGGSYVEAVASGAIESTRRLAYIGNPAPDNIRTVTIGDREDRYEESTNPREQKLYSDYISFLQRRSKT